MLSLKQMPKYEKGDKAEALFNEKLGFYFNKQIKVVCQLLQLKNISNNVE